LLVLDDIENLMKARRNRPLLFIDLSVPRNIDPAASWHQNVTLYNIDDLEALARQGVQGRERELAACHQIIEAHIAALTGQRGSRLIVNYQQSERAQPVPSLAVAPSRGAQPAQLETALIK
jgi:glutamyl-tRNA reductase